LGAMAGNGQGNGRKKTGNSTANPSKDMIYEGQGAARINNLNSKDYSNGKNYMLLNGNNNEHLQTGGGNTVAGGSKKAKLIKIEQIRKIAKKIRLYILMQEIDL
jgi:hypothetical protein